MFRLVAPCGWVIVTRRSDGRYLFHLQCHESVNLFITLKMEAASFFETLRNNYPTTWCNQPKGLIPINQLHIIRLFWCC